MPSTPRMRVASSTATSSPRTSSSLMPGSQAETQVYVSDFGLTKATGSGPSLTGTGQFVGTIDYVVPRADPGPRGSTAEATSTRSSCVLQECLTGEPPFVRDSQLALLSPTLRIHPRRSASGGRSCRWRSTPCSARGSRRIPRIGTRPAGSSSQQPARRSASRARPTTSAVSVQAVVPKRPRRRRLLLAAAALIAVVVAAAVIAVVLATGGDGNGETAPTRIEPDTLSSIDPETNGFSTTLEVGARPEAVAIGPDGIWVANFDSRTVVRVDRGDPDSRYADRVRGSSYRDRGGRGRRCG